jgi:hypothetical protein
MTMPAVEKLREPVEELAALLAQILGCHQLLVISLRPCLVELF